MAYTLATKKGKCSKCEEEYEEGTEIKRYKMGFATRECLEPRPQQVEQVAQKIEKNIGYVKIAPTLTFAEQNLEYCLDKVINNENIPTDAIGQIVSEMMRERFELARQA